MSLRKYRSWVIVGATVVVHLFVAARSVGPMYVFDEIGYLAGGNVIAGHGADWALCGSSYSVGYSVVLAPLWWLPVSPIAIYQIAVFLSAALGALAIWPATLLARRFGASAGVALVIGAFVTLIPARALMSNYVLAENPLTLLVLCAVLLALKVADRARRFDVVLLGATAGLASVVHARALPLVMVTVMWILVRAILKKTRWLDAVAGAALALGLAIGGVVAQTAMGAHIFTDDSRVGNLVGHLSLSNVVEVLMGQAFTQVVSWSLLTVLGVLAVASKARAAWRKHGPQSVATAWWWLGGMFVAQASFFVWVLASSADFATRFDIPIFGRYLDPFAVPVAVLGAVTLWVGARKRIVTVALVISAIFLATYCAAVLPRISPDAKWIPFAIPGLNPFLTVHDSPFDYRPAMLIAGIVALAGCVLLWAFKGRAKQSIVVALAVAALMTVGADALRVDPLEGDSRSTSVTSEAVIANPGHAVTLAADLLPCLEANKIQYELAGTVRIVPTGGDYGTDLVVGPKTWPDATSLGLSKVLLTTWLEAALWTGQQ